LPLIAASDIVCEEEKNSRSITLFAVLIKIKKKHLKKCRFSAKD
jgi:hypothetical protein